MWHLFFYTFLEIAQKCKPFLFISFRFKMIVLIELSNYYVSFKSRRTFEYGKR